MSTVRVVERGQDAGFTLEPRDAIGIGAEGFGERLQRHIPTEVRVMRPVHLSHTADAERAQDLVWTNAGAWTQQHVVSGILSRRRASLCASCAPHVL